LGLGSKERGRERELGGRCSRMWDGRQEQISTGELSAATIVMYCSDLDE
jgi:hypothetical protein